MQAYFFQFSKLVFGLRECFGVGKNRSTYTLALSSLSSTPRVEHVRSCLHLPISRVLHTTRRPALFVPPPYGKTEVVARSRDHCATPKRRHPPKIWLANSASSNLIYPEALPGYLPYPSPSHGRFLRRDNKLPANCGRRAHTGHATTTYWLQRRPLLTIAFKLVPWKRQREASHGKASSGSCADRCDASPSGIAPVWVRKMDFADELCEIPISRFLSFLLSALTPASFLQRRGRRQR